jgi:pimeloyl-ACP methyl ester carboxylesterase
MRSLNLAVLALAFAVALLPSVVRAQDNVEKVTFDTVDQVKLQGLYYPSTKGKKAPAVLMLHKIGGSSTQDGWDKLALDLQKAGFAVLIFDFRGHGNSTTVHTDFWKDSVNKVLPGATAAKPKETISFKDFPASYYPQLVNDITAARGYLDKRNDGGDCNSSNIIVIGAEDGAALGMMWVYSEQLRYRVTAYNSITGQYTKDPAPEGSGISAAIWLSIAPGIGNLRTPMKDWTRYAGAEKNVPMAFVYGEKDTASKGVSEALLALAKDKDGKNKWTGAQAIKGTDLKGHGLLSDKVDGRSWIVDNYLKKLMEDKAMPAWQLKEVRKNGFVWEFPKNSMFSKLPDEDSTRRVPTDLLFNSPVP